MSVNQKNASLIILLRHHRSLGYIFTPFLGTCHNDSRTATLESSLTTDDLRQLNLSKEENKIVELCNSYSDSELMRRFFKRKPRKNEQAIDFIETMSQDKYEKVIRPFIDRRLNEAFDKIVQNNVPVFLKEGTQTKKKVTQQLQISGHEVSPKYFFSRTKEGINYRLQLLTSDGKLNLNEGSIAIVALEPVILLKGEQFFKIESLTIKNLKPFFDKTEVFVPKKFEKKYIESFIRKVVRDAHPEMEGMQIRHHSQSKPGKIILLTQSLEGKPVMELLFSYGGQELVASDSMRPLVAVHYSEGDVIFEKWERQPAEEQKAFDYLQELNLKKRMNGFLVPESAPDPSERDLVKWVNAHRGQLNDYQVRKDTEYLQNDYYTGSLNLDISVLNQFTDWFDIRMVIHLDDISLPFAALKQHIRQGNPEFILADGRVLIIPDAWFTSYGDLVRFARKENDLLRLSRQHIGLLPDTGKEESDNPDGVMQHLYQREFEIIAQTPHGLCGTLRQYQRWGLTWLLQLKEYGLGGCLADDMGLGKTIQTIALLLLTKESGALEKDSQEQTQLTLFTEESEVRRPSLLVMPTSLLYNWKNEMTRFAPKLKVLIYTGQRAKLPEKFHRYDVVLTSYGVMRIDVGILKKFSFHYLVLDESQFVKNPHSKTYQALLELHADYRLALTGTPVENSLSDLWAQLHFLNRDLLGSYNFFQERFVVPIERDHNEEREQRLKQLIHPFILRRRKEEVVKELPDLTEQVYYCEMSEAQEEAYERYKSGIRNSLLDVFEEGIAKNEMRILEALLRMRQMANHPKLAAPDYEGESGKFNEVIRSVQNLVSEGHKALLFSSFAGYLKLFAAYFDEQQTPYAMITGQTKDREAQVNKFQQDENTRLFLISLKAGGTGLNLTAADYVFILDPWWNPAAENQALSRAHRIGQTQKVFVYRFITRKTIEEKIFGLQKRKQELADTFVNFNNPLKQLSEEEIRQLFDFKT